MAGHNCHPFGRIQRLNGSGLESLADALACAPYCSPDAYHAARAGAKVERTLSACRCGRVCVGWSHGMQVSLSVWTDGL